MDQSEGAFMVTVDVVGLFTNIPSEGEAGGLQAMEKALKSCQTATVGTEFLLKMMKLVLK